MKMYRGKKKYKPPIQMYYSCRYKCSRYSDAFPHTHTLHTHTHARAHTHTHTHATVEILMFQYGYHYLGREYYASSWTASRRRWRSLQNCVSERRYVAIGMGGRSHGNGAYTREVTVAMRRRQAEGDPKVPLRCLGAIPDFPDDR